MKSVRFGSSFLIPIFLSLSLFADTPDFKNRPQMTKQTRLQIIRLLDAAGEPWRTVFQFALSTGMRRNEILGLQWRDLDLDATRLPASDVRVFPWEDDNEGLEG